MKTTDTTNVMNPMRALVVVATVGQERDSGIYELAADLLYAEEMQQRGGGLVKTAPIDLLIAADGEARALRLVIVQPKLMEEVDDARPERRLEASGAIQLMCEVEDGRLLMLVALARKCAWLPGDAPAGLAPKGAPHA